VPPFSAETNSATNGSVKVVQQSVQPPLRDDALDGLRGLAILGMVIVNLQGSPTAGFSILVHSPWNGVTLADLVFPFFLLASGLAVPLALDGRNGAGRVAKAARRASLLFLIGLGLGWMLHPSLDLAQLRVAGVLQRIAIVYFVSAAVCLAKPGWRWPLSVAVVLMLLHGALLLVPIPGDVIGTLVPGGGVSGWLDRAALPGRLHRVIYDPEGLLSTLSSIASGLIGVAVQRGLRESAAPLRPILLCGLACIALGLAIQPVLPFNKTLWTPSFALVTDGIGLVVWGGLRALWPRLAGIWAVDLVVVLGRTALTLYVLHMLLVVILIRPYGAGNVWEATFAPFLATGLPPAWASLLYALMAGALSTLITLALRQRGWLLRV